MSRRSVCICVLLALLSGLVWFSSHLAALRIYQVTVVYVVPLALANIYFRRLHSRLPGGESLWRGLPGQSWRERWSGSLTAKVEAGRFMFPYFGWSYTFRQVSRVADPASLRGQLWRGCSARHLNGDPEAALVSLLTCDRLHPRFEATCIANWPKSPKIPNSGMPILLPPAIDLQITSGLPTVIYPPDPRCVRSWQS